MNTYRKNAIFDEVRKLLFTISIILFCTEANAQVAEIDSLRRLLKNNYPVTNTAADTSRINVLVELASKNLRVDPDGSLESSKEALL